MLMALVGKSLLHFDVDYDPTLPVSRDALLVTLDALVTLADYLVTLVREDVGRHAILMPQASW
jgi:hypothetical protein